MNHELNQIQSSMKLYIANLDRWIREQAYFYWDELVTCDCMIQTSCFSVINRSDLSNEFATSAAMQDQQPRQQLQRHQEGGEGRKEPTEWSLIVIIPGHYLHSTLPQSTLCLWLLCILLWHMSESWKVKCRWGRKQWQNDHVLDFLT